MTFKKAEMAKTLRNGLSMIETNPLNHNWSHFVILLGLTLHQFQKKLLLSEIFPYSWVPNRRVYSFIWHQRNMKKETDTKTDKSI